MSKKAVPVALALCAVFILGVMIGRLSVLRGAAIIQSETGGLPEGRMAQLTLPSGTKESTATKVNINAAPAEELSELPGIGPALAVRIVEYRNQNGPFESLEELKAVKGIGDQVFRNVADLITIK